MRNRPLIKYLAILVFSVPVVVFGHKLFPASTISSAADGAYSVYAVDMDGDGDMDVLSASAYDDKIIWYENDGSESFTAATITTSADNAKSVYAVDLDGDGEMDVLSASKEDDKIAWYEQGTAWWVDLNNGNDSNSGSSNFPFKTIQQAIESNSSLEDGDSIKVKPSITSSNTTGYYDFGNDDISTSKEFILISTAGAATTILDAEERNRHFFFNGDQDSTLQIVGFTF